jgi:hypothetical protein
MQPSRRLSQFNLRAIHAVRRQELRDRMRALSSVSENFCGATRLAPTSDHVLK